MSKSESGIESLKVIPIDEVRNKRLKDEGPELERNEGQISEAGKEIATFKDLFDDPLKVGLLEDLQEKRKVMHRNDMIGFHEATQEKLAPLIKEFGDEKLQRFALYHVLIGSGLQKRMVKKGDMEMDLPGGQLMKIWNELYEEFGDRDGNGHTGKAVVNGN